MPEGRGLCSQIGQFDVSWPQSSQPSRRIICFRPQAWRGPEARLWLGWERHHTFRKPVSDEALTHVPFTLTNAPEVRFGDSNPLFEPMSVLSDPEVEPQSETARIRLSGTLRPEVRSAENLALALRTGRCCFGKRLSAQDSADGYSARKATVGSTSQARRAGR